MDLKTFKEFPCFFLNFKDFQRLKDLYLDPKTFKDFKDRYEPCKYRIVERCVFNRTMAAYSIFKFQNMNIQCYFTQKLRDFRLGNKKN